MGYFVNPSKSITLIGAGTCRVAGRSRPWQAHASHNRAGPGQNSQSRATAQVRGVDTIRASTGPRVSSLCMHIGVSRTPGRIRSSQYARAAPGAALSSADLNSVDLTNAKLLTAEQHTFTYVTLLAHRYRKNSSLTSGHSRQLRCLMARSTRRSSQPDHRHISCLLLHTGT